jgi:uncharacterized RmlC-like cupin family protein
MHAPYPARVPPKICASSFTLVLALASFVSASSDTAACPAETPATTSAGYAAAADAHVRGGGPRTPPGSTRSIASAGLYGVLAPDSRVYGAPAPGWTGPAPAAAVVTPALGAHFVMYIVRAGDGALLEGPTTFAGAPKGLERFFYVLTGRLVVREMDNGVEDRVELTPGDFVYVAPGEKSILSIAADQPVSFVRTFTSFSRVAALSYDEHQIALILRRILVFCTFRVYMF